MIAPRHIVLVLFAAGIAGAVDLSAIRAQPDLDKRALLAMTHADECVDVVRKDWDGGRMEEARTRVSEIQSSVQLAYDSLRQTGKQPHNNKYYKRVELNMRELVRRMEGLQNDAPYDDRASVEQVLKGVQDLHDQILMDIMSRRK
jgi:hypothetical protein